jgi:hypothetical protein
MHVKMSAKIHAKTSAKTSVDEVSFDFLFFPFLIYYI